MPTKTAPNLSTVERFLDEVDEYYGNVRRIRQKLSRVKRGSNAYLDLLPELWVQVDWLRLKAETAAKALDDFEESLPEEDTG